MSIKKNPLKDGSVKWIVRVWSNGRGSKRLKRSFDKRVDAENFLHDFKVRAHTLQKSAVQISNFEETTFAEEAAAWLDDGKLRFSAGHLQRVQGVLSEYLPKIGRMTPDKFTPSFLASLQKQMKEQGSMNGTVNRKTEVITAILNFSVKHRRIPFSPCGGFKKLPLNQAEMLFWDRVEAQSFLEFANKKYPPESSERWIYVSYLLALNTALRAGEIWGLQPRDLVDDGQILFIRRQYNRVTHDFGLTKGKKSRNVPCNDELRKELRFLIAKRNTKLDQTIFHGIEGRPINHDSFGDRRFDKDVKLWGGRRIRFHGMRHTAATLMIGSGIDLKTVKEICGHKNIMTTMNYAHLLGENLRSVAQTFSIKPNEISKKDETKEEAKLLEKIEVVETPKEFPKLRLVKA